MYLNCNLFQIKCFLNNTLLTNRHATIASMVSRCFCGKVIDTNTKVTKDVILYKFINDRNFKIANIFAVSQFGFWTYLSLFAFNSLKDAPTEKTDEVKTWWQKLNIVENKYRNGLMILTFSIGMWSNERKYWLIVSVILF